MNDILTSLEDQVRPQHTALLVIDMQNDFCAEGGYLQRTRAASGRNPIRVDENEGIADRIGVLAAAARGAGMPVVWLRSVYDFKYLEDSQIAQRNGEEGCCLEGTWGVDFFRIAPAAGDVVVDKHTYSGFHRTTLDETLRRRGIRTLVLCGVATNVCVESTLRHGFFLGYHVVLAEDCVGSGNKTGHEGTLSTVRVNFGKVVDSAALCELFTAERTAQA